MELKIKWIQRAKCDKEVGGNEQRLGEYKFRGDGLKTRKILFSVYTFKK